MTMRYPDNPSQEHRKPRTADAESFTLTSAAAKAGASKTACTGSLLDGDMSRIRKDNGPEVLARLRRLALNIARADRCKGSLAGKLRGVTWNDDALLNMLSQTPWAWGADRSAASRAA